MSGDLRAEILGLRTSQRSVAFADAMHDRALDEVLDLIPEGAVLVTEEFRQAAMAVVDAYLSNDQKALLGACADLSAVMPDER